MKSHKKRKEFMIPLFFFLNVQVRDLRCVHECMLVHAFLLQLFSYMNFISCLSSQFFKVVNL